MNKKFLVLLLGMVLFVLNVNAETCVVGNGAVSFKECLTNQDINVFELMTFDGNLTHNFDINVSIFREETSTFLVQNQQMTVYTPQTGLYYHEIVGGYSDAGEYLVFITAEHLIDGSPDGNMNSVAYNFTIRDSSVSQLIIDSNSYLSDAILGKIKVAVAAFSAQSWEGGNFGESETTNIKKVNAVGIGFDFLLWVLSIIFIGALLAFGFWYVKKKFFIRT